MSTDTNGTLACKKVDFLLVLDNSASMDQWNSRVFNLAYAFEELIRGSFLGNVESFHFAVTTTDAFEDNTDGCNIPGAIVRYGGVPEGPCEFAEGHPYATNADNLTEALECMAIMLVDGSPNERPMEALLGAVSPQLNGPGGCNEGFSRNDALLVVVIITDEDDDHADVDGQGNDGSPAKPIDWYNLLVAYKQGDPNAVVMGVLVGDDEGTGTCPWSLGGPDETMATGAEEAKRIEQFVGLFPFNNRAIGSICSDDYIPFFQDFFAVNAQVVCEEFVPS